MFEARDEAGIGGLPEVVVGYNHDTIRDIFWAYHNYGNKKLRERDAPSPGAWGLALFALEDPKSFLTQLLPKAMAAVQVSSESEAFESQIRTEERRPVGELRSMLASAVTESQLLSCPNCDHKFAG